MHRDSRHIADTLLPTAPHPLTLATTGSSSASLASYTRGCVPESSLSLAASFSHTL